MQALSTTHPMSKITQSAISQKPVNQKKKKKRCIQVTYFYTFLQIFDSKFKIPIATEISELFWHLGNRHLTVNNENVNSSDKCVQKMDSLQEWILDYPYRNANNSEGCRHITSNDRPFGCPIICTDINSQCYFFHWHLRQCWIQWNSLANQEAIFVDNLHETKKSLVCLGVEIRLLSFFIVNPILSDLAILYRLTL